VQVSSIDSVVLDYYFGSVEFITGQAARALLLIDLAEDLEVKAIKSLLQKPGSAPRLKH
jgi:hypothetical protein